MTGATGPGLLLAAALLVWSPADSGTARRVRQVAGPPRRRLSAPRATWAGRPGQRRVLAGSAGCAVGLLVGGVAGAVLAVLVGLVAERMLRSSAGDDREHHAALARELPIACDLLAVGLAAGLPVGGAVAAVADAVAGPLADVLHAVAGLYRLGAEPQRAWAGVPGEVTALGRVLVRAGESGSAVGAALRSLAADSRAAARARIEADVRRAGVWVLAPLGLCFLPAFLCLGVVPVVLGIAGDVFR
jgi:pilus assembly protein TadC